jgi:hypothetical protein
MEVILLDLGDNGHFNPPYMGNKAVVQPLALDDVHLQRGWDEFQVDNRYFGVHIQFTLKARFDLLRAGDTLKNIGFKIRKKHGKIPVAFGMFLISGP